MTKIEDKDFLDLVADIKVAVTDPELLVNLDKAVAGNKSASARFRVASIKLGKLFKEYRAMSVKLENPAKDAEVEA